MKAPRLQEPALTLLLEEVRKGKHDVYKDYTQGYFPGGRECVPKNLGTFFLGMAREEMDDNKP
jgi:hypothetical protein